MDKKILITGGTGLIGTRLTEILLQKGYKVVFLSRNPKPNAHIPTFKWDIEKDYIDDKAFEGIDFIIHLAGENVGEKSWSESQKKAILDSRVNSILLLAKKIQELDIKLKGFLSASAIGYYGADTGDLLCDENTPNGKDFLAQVTQEWEDNTNVFPTLNIPVSLLRIGIVLAKNGGALPKLTQPIRWGVGASLGSGKQFLSWIHIDDVCNMFVFLIEKQLFDTYNAVAPTPVNNTEMTKLIAKVLHKPLFLPNIPSFVLNMMLGEFSKSILGGNKVSSKKITTEGFSFAYPYLETALRNLL